MDNKVTKKRFNDQMEYDWFKYVLIIIVSIVVWIFVFQQINASKDFETIHLFVTAYDYKVESTGDFTDTVKNRFEAAGDDTIREMSLEHQSPQSSEYNTLLQTHGYVTSDILVIGKSQMEFAAGGFLELTGEVLSYMIPEDYEPQFYVMTVDGVDYRRGIRVDKAALPGIDRIFEFNPQGEVPDPVPEGEEYKYDTEFYLVINPKSANIGKFGKKSRDENLHTLTTVKYLIERYK